MADSEEFECSSEGHVTAGRRAVEEEWKTSWYDGECKDANREVSKWLKEHIYKLTGGKTKCRILVPMCGASRDMQWLVDAGHEVIGLELVDKALHLFLERHHIDYTTSDVPSVNDGKCYKSKDKLLTLYRCNIFEMDMSLITKVDCVWDCGAMTDIPPAERKDYAEIILSALKPEGRIMAETFTFGEIEDSTDANDDHEHLHEGHDDDDFPCRPVEEKDFQKMYGEHCSIEMLCEEDSKEAEEWGPSWWAKNRLHLLIHK